MTPQIDNFIISITTSVNWSDDVELNQTLLHWINRKYRDYFYFFPSFLSFCTLKSVQLDQVECKLLKSLNMGSLVWFLCFSSMLYVLRHIFCKEFIVGLSQRCMWYLRYSERGKHQGWEEILFYYEETSMYVQKR